jgi:hypothetical protein
MPNFAEEIRKEFDYRFGYYTDGKRCNPGSWSGCKYCKSVGKCQACDFVEEIRSAFKGEK